MATEYEVGVKLKGDGSGLVGASKEAQAAQLALNEELRRTSTASREAQSAEAARKVEAMATKRALDEQTQAQAGTRAEAERLTAKVREQSESLGRARTDLEAYERGAAAVQKQSLLTGHAMDFFKGTAFYDALKTGIGLMVDYVKESAQLAARYETLGVVMGVVGRNAGYTAREMDIYAESVRKMGITQIESRNSVIQLAQAEIDLSQATQLARIAQDAAVIGGVNSSQALQTLIHGIRSAQTDVLRTIGINVSFEESYKRLALQLGKKAEALSEAEKMQARTNAVFEAGARIAGTYEAAMGTAGKMMGSLARYSEDLKVLRGQIWNEALIIGVNAYTDSLKDADQETRRLANDQKFKQWGRDIIEVFAFVGDAVRGAWDVIAQSVETTAVVMLQSYNAVVQILKYTPQGAALNLATGGAEKLQNFTDAFTNRANENLAARLNRRQFRDSAAEIFSTQDADAARRKAAEEAEVAGLVITGFLPRPKKDTLAAPGKAKAEQSDFDRLYVQSRERLAVLEAEAGATDKLTKAEIALARAQADVLAGKSNLTEAQFMALEVYLGEEAAAERAARAREASRKLDAEILKDRERWIAQEASAIAKTDESIRSQREANEEIGLTTEQLGRLRLARIDDRIAMEEAHLFSARVGGDEQYAQMLERQIAQLRELRGLKAENVQRTVAAEQARAAAEEWRRTSDTIQRSLTDALMRGFDRGKSFAQNFRDSLVAMFKTLVLEPVIRPIAQGAAGVVTSMLMPGVANAAGPSFGLGGFNPLGMLGSGEWLGGAATSLFGSSATTAALIESGTVGMAGAGIEAAAGMAGLGPVGLGIGALALLAGGGLFGGGGGPKPSQLGIYRGGDGRFYISQTDVPGGDANLALYRGVEAQLNNPAMYHPDVLASYVGGGITGGEAEGAQQMVQRLLQWTQHARDAAGSAAAAAQAATVAQNALAERLAAERARADETIGGFAAQVYQMQFEHGIANLSALDQDIARMRLTVSQRVAEVQRGLSSHDDRHAVGVAGMEAAAQMEQLLRARDAELRAQEEATRLVEERNRLEEEAMRARLEDARALTTGMQQTLALVDQVAAYRRQVESLNLAEVSPLTARERLDFSRSQYAELLGTARGGDAGALSLLGGGMQAYLREAESFYGRSTPTYRAIFEAAQADGGSLVASWNASLADRLTNQTIDFSRLQLPMEQVADNTKGLDARIAAAIERALAALASANEASARAQTRAIVEALIENGVSVGRTLAGAIEAQTRA